MQTGSVHAQVEVAENILHDLAKGQGHNGQIVAPEPQHGNADDKADQARQHAADDHADHQPQHPIGHRPGQQRRDNNACKRADAHKARMAQAQFPADTHQQVQRNRQNDIGTGRNQEAPGGAVQLALGGQKLQNEECSRHQDIGGCIFDLIQLFLHRAHLKPSPGPACPADPQASPAK